MSDFNFSFEGINEEKSKKFIPKYLTCGIHEVTLRNIRKEVKGEYEFMSIDLEGSEKYTDEDGNVKFQSVTVSFYKPRNSEDAEKLGKKLIHLFSKVGGRTKVEEVKKHIAQQKFASFDDMVKYFKKIGEDKKVRIKLVADYKQKKYATLPGYFSGWAECIDLVPSELRYDAKKEGPQEKDDSKVEKDSDGPFSFGSEDKKDDSDGLPF